MKPAKPGSTTRSRGGGAVGLGSIYHYIIAGAGSAGSVLAARLSEDSAVNVLLIEAGGRGRNPLISVPMGFIKLLGRKQYYWEYGGEDEPGLPGRPQTVLHGKGLGGSSSINGMIVVRGHAGDYDEWAGLGNVGWSHDDVLPYFKRLETRPEGDGFHRGRAGPISVRSELGDNPLYGAFHQAVLDAGHPETPDYNGASQWGVSRTQHSVTRGTARRGSPLGAYLRPAMGRANLHIVTNAVVTRVVIDRMTARGVDYVMDGQSHRAMAEAEVVLSAGAYKTSHILMHSGIGCGDHLRGFGIDAVHHLPGVGQNLQDHLGSFVQRACSQPVSILETTKPWGQVVAALRYGLTGSGPLSHYPAENMAFLKTNPALDRPDLQFFIGPFLRPPAGSSLGPGVMTRHGYCISWCQLRPTSHGGVTLSSGEPLSTPRVIHNYLGTREDRDCQRRAVALARELHVQSAFDLYRGEELEPGADCVSRNAVDRYIEQSCHTHFHPVGTAAMGHDDGAVVDSRLRVHGIENLRVVDASVMPRLVGANTNIPTIMIAEKAADMIRDRPPLPAETVVH